MTFPAGQQPGQPPAQQGSDQQGQGSATTGDQQGQQNSGQQGGQQVPSLLDTLAQQAHQQIQQSGQQGGQQGAPGGIDLQQLVSQLVPLLGTQIAGSVESAVDRRINRDLQNRMAQGGQQQQGQQQQQQQPPEQPRDQHGRFVTGPDPFAVREARMAFRDYIGDRLQFVSAVEREWVMDVGASLVQARITPGADPDAVAREVATSVAERTRGLRQHYEEQLLTALRARGIDPTGGGKGAASLPQGVPAAANSMEAARAAARTLAQTANTERGWQPQQPAAQ